MSNQLSTPQTQLYHAPDCRCYWQLSLNPYMLVTGI